MLIEGASGPQRPRSFILPLSLKAQFADDHRSTWPVVLRFEAGDANENDAGPASEVEFRTKEAGTERRSRPSFRRGNLSPGFDDERQRASRPKSAAPHVRGSLTCLEVLDIICLSVLGRHQGG